MREKYFAADDWGFSPAINDGILALAERGWLGSVSMAANSAFLHHRLKELLTHSGLRFSLHLNLTWGVPLSPADELPGLTRKGRFVSHRVLMIKAVSGRISVDQVYTEAVRQLDALVGAGVPVRAVDGHHHVHLLPGIRKAVVRLMGERGLREIRVMRDRAHWPSFLQSRMFASPPPGKLREWTCHYLRPTDLRSREAFLRKLSAGVPLLVHPAERDDFSEARMDDRLRSYRVFELQTIRNYLEGAGR